MADTMQLIASLEWLALGIIVFIGMRRWNKRFGEVCDELQEDMERWRSDG